MMGLAQLGCLICSASGAMISKIEQKTAL